MFVLKVLKIGKQNFSHLHQLTTLKSVIVHYFFYKVATFTSQSKHLSAITRFSSFRLEPATLILPAKKSDCNLVRFARLIISTLSPSLDVFVLGSFSTLQVKLPSLSSYS